MMHPYFAEIKSSRDLFTSSYSPQWLQNFKYAVSPRSGKAYGLIIISFAFIFVQFRKKVVNINSTRMKVE